MSAQPNAQPAHPDRQLLLGPQERSLEDAPCWPVTRLAGASLTLLLALSILAPAAFGGTSAAEWVALALATILATLAARALFEVLSFAAARPGVGAYLLASVPPTLVALALMAGTALTVGARWPLGGVLVSAALTPLTFAAAVATRAVEVRVRLAMRRVYFIGSSATHADLARELSRRSDARLVGFTPADSHDAPVDHDRLVVTVLAANPTVLVLDEASRNPALVQVAGALNLTGLRVRDLVSYYEQEFKKVPLAELTPAWFLFDIASIHRRGINLLLRRAVEWMLAALLLALASPLLLALMALVKLTSSGPALYRQERVGKDAVPFTLLKLRTMSESSTTDAEWVHAHKQRITPVGRLLRRFRVDEVPQLWNVLRGDLALIGPRPEQIPIVERLVSEIPFYNARHCIRPGLTGWAQVNLGYGGSFDGTVAKLQRDLYYVKHRSLRLDALILWLTLVTVLAGRG